MGYDDDYNNEFNETNFDANASENFEDDTVVITNDKGEREKFFVIGQLFHKGVFYLIASQDNYENNTSDEDTVSSVDNNNDADDGNSDSILEDDRLDIDGPKIVVLRRSKNADYELLKEEKEVNTILKLFNDQLVEGFSDNNDNTDGDNES
jgi:hypothetical protein